MLLLAVLLPGCLPLFRENVVLSNSFSNKTWLSHTEERKIILYSEVVLHVDFVATRARREVAGDRFDYVYSSTEKHDEKDMRM